MPTDIFDEVAEAQSPKGDIFDEVAESSSRVPQPESLRLSEAAAIPNLGPVSVPFEANRPLEVPPRFPVAGGGHGVGLLDVETDPRAAQSILGISPEKAPTAAALMKAGAPAALAYPVSLITRTAAGLGGYTTSPRGVIEAGTATVAAPVVLAKWAYDMLKGGYESGKDLTQRLVAKMNDALNRQIITHNDLGIPPESTREESDAFKQAIAEDALNIVASPLMAAGMGRGAVRGITSRFSTEPVTIQPAGETYASDISRPTPIPELEVRPPMGETPPLRYEREVAGAREQELGRGSETEVLPQPQPQAVAPVKDYGQQLAEEAAAFRQKEEQDFLRRQAGLATKPTETLPALVKRVGRQKVEEMIGDWDSNAQLSPDGKSITTFADPRNQTGKVRSSSKEFMSWVAEQAPKPTVAPAELLPPEEQAALKADLEASQEEPPQPIEVVGKVKGMSPDEVSKAVMGAVYEGGAIQGLKTTGEKTGHYVVVPPEKGVPGDEPMAVGPFESKPAAQDFLDAEVGAPGAKVVEVISKPPARPTATTAESKLKLIGLNDADISDLKSGNASVSQIVARKLPGEEGRGPEHAKALEEARLQAVSQIESVLQPTAEIPGEKPTAEEAKPMRITLSRIKIYVEGGTPEEHQALANERQRNVVWQEYNTEGDKISEQEYKPTEPPAPTPPPAPAAETTVAKEPWKMTLQTYRDREAQGFESLATMQEGKDITGMPVKKAGEHKRWQEQQAQMAVETREGRNDTVDLMHKKYVQQAISRGKPVPPEVLADYPDLAKQAVTEPEVVANEAEAKWNAQHPELSYKRALEVEGVSDYPREDAALFNFDKLTPDEQRAVIADQEKELVRAKADTKRQFQLGKEAVASFKGTDFEGKGMDEHKQALKYQRLVEQRLVRLKASASQQQSPRQVLSTAATVQIKAPEGATQIRITDKSGKVAVAPISALQKSNTFRGVDIAKVEAGIIGKDKKFKPVAGELTVREPISVGPGAETAGEAKYSAIQQLVDQLKTVPDTGLPEKITARERIADAWSRGKSAMDGLTARLQATTQSLKDTARGVRDVTDLDRRIGGLDWALQRSAAMSKRAKVSIRSEVKDQATRDAVAIWNDTPGTDAEKIAAIQDTLANLPANMPNRIRRALQKATNLDPKARDFSESLRQYYGIRLNDAQEAAIFEHGLEDYYTHIWKKEANMPDDLRAAISNGRVSTYFEFARKRKFGTFLDGIRAGKVPELDPADVIPIYNYSLDRAIASRQFIRDVSEMVEPDGRPTLAPAGRSIPVERGGTPDRLIIKPKARSEELVGYESINHPALRKWKWAGTDENGNPILYQSDLLVHPNSYQRLSRMMDRSRLTPSPLVRSLLGVSTEVKGMKLGLLSAFHAIHTGSHALFHWTNPFRAGRIPIDWESPATKFAVEKGHLKLAPDPGELKIASEGIVPGRLVEKIPILGPWSRAWSEFQFGELIPRWKLATFENAYKRNLWARDNVPLSGLKGLTDEQIAARAGDSVNNAFGELNQLFLGKYGRSPEMKRILRAIFLAPDFGEARLRFVEKALTKAGFEERLAIATMFLTLYTGARVANYLSHGDPEMDWKKAFAVKFGDHWWSMRSVVGDLDHLFADFGRFMYVRLNPVYARTASDMLFGRDVSGRKLTAWQKFVSRPLDQLIPIQFGALTRDDQKIWESFVTAMGVQTQRDSPTHDLRQIIGNWKKASTNPKIRADWERSQQELFAPSPYEPLRNALRLDNPGRAVEEYRKLRQIRKPAEIDRAMQNKRPFTGSLQAERQFTAQMTPEQAVVYREAVKEREELYRKYLAILHNEVQPSTSYFPMPQTEQESPMGE